MITINTAGVQIDTFDTILAEIQADFRSHFGVSVPTDLKSSMGQLQRLMATREEQQQQMALSVYQNLDPRLAEGVHLDQRNSLLGVTRLAAQFAEVLGTATGTPATPIPNGTRLSVGGVFFQVADGPYTIGGGGTVAGVKVVAEVVGVVDVAVLGAWTIEDVVAGFDSFEDDSQPVEGRLTETATEYRVRTETERFRRGSGPLNAIEAAVLDVKGVTYARAWDNRTVDPVDADGIPLHTINVIAVGGLDADVAAAIFASGPAGHQFYGTSVTETVEEGPAAESVSFDRVETITMWATITITTSTSEEDAPADLESVATAAAVAYADENWSIGTDALPHRLVGALSTLKGADDIDVTLSTDDGAGDPYTDAKRAISIRQQAVLTTARVTIVLI